MIEELYFAMGLATILYIWVRNRFWKAPEPLEHTELMDVEPLTPPIPMEICETEEKQNAEIRPLESPNWDSLLDEPLQSISETFTIKKSPSWCSLVEEVVETGALSDLDDMSSD